MPGVAEGLLDEGAPDEDFASVAELEEGSFAEEPNRS